MNLVEGDFSVVYSKESGFVLLTEVHSIICCTVQILGIHASLMILRMNENSRSHSKNSCLEIYFDLTVSESLKLLDLVLPLSKKARVKFIIYPRNSSIIYFGSNYFK